MTGLLPGADQGCYVDIDDTIKATHGHAKQGAGYARRAKTRSESHSPTCE